MQIQISSCTSHCQGTTQVQVASQAASNVQALGSAAQLASQIDAQPTPAETSTATGTITQIQLGCVSHCDGTTTSAPPARGLAQSVVSQLSSLLPPNPGPGDAQPGPATVQTSVTQLACQLQVAGGGTDQLQAASQRVTTVQVVEVQPAPPADAAPPAPPGVVATQQVTWQLQVGCLFYCVETQQVQEATQTATTIQLTGGRTITVVQQTIFQVQIGCLAWCYDSTQVQAAAGQSTTTVVVSPPAVDGPSPAPASAPRSGAGATDPVVPAAQSTGPPPPPAAPAPIDSSAAGPPSVTAGRFVRLLASARSSGSAVVASWSLTRVAEPSWPSQPPRFSAATAPRPAASVATRRSLRLGPAHPRTAHRPLSADRHARPARTDEARVNGATVGGESTVLVLVLAGALAAGVVGWRASRPRPARTGS